MPPIFGADLVSLPGNKHLIALDHQPPSGSGVNDYITSALVASYEKFVLNSNIEDGKKMKDGSMKFFSEHAIWCKPSKPEEIQTLVFDTFVDYLDAYKECIVTTTTATTTVAEGYEKYLDLTNLYC